MIGNFSWTLKESGTRPAPLEPTQSAKNAVHTLVDKYLGKEASASDIVNHIYNSITPLDLAKLGDIGELIRNQSRALNTTDLRFLYLLANKLCLENDRLKRKLAETTDVLTTTLLKQGQERLNFGRFW